jgi:O-antigen/teichoic acid export membrane protein
MIKKIKERPFVFNVAAVASGAVASQGIAMAFAPLITRLYGPEVYGVQGVFLMVTGLLTHLWALSYPLAIVLPRSEAEALDIAHLALGVGVLMTVLMTVILGQYGAVLLDLLNAGAILDFVYLIPVTLFLALLADLLTLWLIRKNAFLLLSQTRVLSAFLTGLLRSGWGFLQPSVPALILANAFSNVLTVVLILIGARRSALGIRPCLELAAPSPGFWRLARRHRDFPLLRTPQNLINTFSQALPIVLLAGWSGTPAVGYYIVALSVLALPPKLIGDSVIQVFYPRITRAVHAGEDCRQLIAKATLGLMVSGALILLPIVVAGPALFAFVFGAEWDRAGVYAQILSPWLFLQYVNKPAIAAIPALELQGGLLIYELFSTGSKILALWVGFKVFADELAALILFSAVGVIAYVWLILWVIHRSSQAHTLTVVDP